MAINSVDTVSEFCTAGDRSAFSPAKLITGYTGTENDPAFAENINDYWNQLSAAINQHATVINDEIIPLVEQNELDILVLISDVDDLEIDVARNSWPVGTVFMYLGSSIPSGWARLTGQTFDQVLYPLLYAANGNSNTLPDMRNRAPYGANTLGQVKQTSNGSNIEHSHDDGTLSAASNGNHNHPLNGDVTLSDTTYRNEVDSTGAEVVVSFESAGSVGPGLTISNNLSIANDGAHTHGVNGDTGDSGGSTNVPVHLKLHFIVFLE